MTGNFTYYLLLLGTNPEQDYYLWPNPLHFIVECDDHSAVISTNGDLDLNIEHVISVEIIPYFEIPLSSFQIVS